MHNLIGYSFRMRIVGLDIGCSSIGWCVLDGQSILALGTRVFPPKRNISRMSPSQQRAKYRTARDKNRKTAVRLKQLADLLVSAELLPAHDRAATPNVARLFELALVLQIAPFQFGAVLMFLAKHLGKAPKRQNPYAEKRLLTSHPVGFSPFPNKKTEWQRRDATHAFAKLWRVQSRFFPKAFLEHRNLIARHLFDQSVNSKKGTLHPIDHISNGAEQRSVNQLGKVLETIIGRFGMPDVVASELFQAPVTKPDSATVKSVRRATNLGSRRAQLRHALWLELPELRANVRQCIYSGDEMDLECLNSEQVEIDHIIPRSRGGSNLCDNLLLCAAKANRTKNDQLIKDVSAWKSETAAILHRAIRLPVEKFQRLETGLEPKSKVDYDPDLGRLTRISLDACTRYLRARFAKTSTRLVHANGHETAKYRDRWQLDRLLSIGQNGKNRHDHRHHAVDAFVLAKLAAGACTDETKSNAALSIFLPKVFTSHKVDHGCGGKVKTNSTTSGLLTEQTAYGPTLFHDGHKRRYGVIRKPISDLKTVGEINMVRDVHLRAVLLAQLDGKDSAPDLSIKRVRVFEGIHNPVEVRNGDGQIFKFLKPGANFRYDIWALKDGKWQAEVVTVSQTHQGHWQSGVKQRHPTAHKVLSLHHNDCIALEENGQATLMRVVKFSANDRLCLAPINAAGDLKARDADLNDPFHYTVRSAAGLKARNSRQVRIDILGEISDPFIPHK